jgi:hypothetical protein
VLPITVLRRDRYTVSTSLFGCFDPKVVAMLAEIFMVRLEAERRLVEQALPGTSRFVPFSRKSQFALKETDLNGDEAPSNDRPVGVVR